MRSTEAEGEEDVIGFHWIIELSDLTAIVTHTSMIGRIGASLFDK